RLAAAAAVVVLAVLAIAQLVLPRIAASRISSRVGRYGHVEHVSVSAWPAVELLWGDADSVRVSASRLALSPAQAAALLWEGRGVARMDLTAAAARIGTLQLDDAALHKRGELLSAEAHASAAAVRAALPAGMSVRLLRSGGGQIEVQASGALFGLGAAIDAIAGPLEGRLIARPAGELLSGLQLKLFSDPHVHVSAVGASGDGAGGYRLSMGALLR
ncbi:MAG TPA: hypothetical protein VGD00_07730, partial [Solirubrobacteraceae bacterium]